MTAYRPKPLRPARTDLVILDLNLPEMDGLDVLRSLRARRSSSAVLILTARGAMDDRVKGLDLGADDYMAKPPDIPELEARVRVLLRRRAGLHNAEVSFGDVTLDTVSCTVFARGAPLDVPCARIEAARNAADEGRKGCCQTGDHRPAPPISTTTSAPMPSSNTSRACANASRPSTSP